MLVGGGEGHPPAIRYVYMQSATDGGFEFDSPPEVSVSKNALLESLKMDL